MNTTLQGSFIFKCTNEYLQNHYISNSYMCKIKRTVGYLAVIKIGKVIKDVFKYW